MASHDEPESAHAAPEGRAPNVGLDLLYKIAGTLIAAALTGAAVIAALN